MIKLKKSFMVLVTAEIIVLLISVYGLFGKNNVYEYGPECALLTAGTYDGSGIYLDADMGQDISDIVVSFENISLPAGSYEIKLKYTTDTDAVNICYADDDTMAGKMLRTNGAQLYSGLNSTDYDMTLLEATSKLSVNVEYQGSGMLYVQGLTILQNNKLNRCILFCVLLLFTLINLLYFYREYDREHHISVRKKTVAFCLGVTTLIAAAPLLTDSIHTGGDLVYHLMRIEGIKDGILAGQFPIRISPEWQQGYGYASPIFYGETLLYIAALFRLIGFTVEASYKIFMFLVAAATVLISYASFKHIFRDEYVGVFCSLLYSVSIYRIYKTYFCGALGECFGVMLLPLIAWGFYNVFTQDIHDKSYRKNWIVLTVGFTLLLQSHLLTCEMVGLFTIILCVVLWKKVFRKETFIVLAKTVVYTILLSAWFIVPFADYMLTGDFVIHHVSGRTIQYRGLLPAHLLMTFFIDGGNVFFDTGGMADSAPVGVGLVLIIPLLILIYFFFSGKAKKLEKNMRGLAVASIAFSCAAMLMSLCIFPWDCIQQINQLAATLVSSIQFPNRFLTIASLCLVLAAGVTAKYIMENCSKSWKAAFFSGMMMLVAICNIYLMEQGYETGGFTRIYNSEGMGTGYISGGEYLPTGASAGDFVYHDPVCTGELQYSNYEKQSLGAFAYMVNGGAETETATYALLYYKGYHAYEADTGQELNCYSGENCQVTVDIPAGFEGNVQVKFVSPVYWRIAEIVTAVTLLSMVLCAVYGAGKRKKENKSVCAGEVSHK